MPFPAEHDHRSPTELWQSTSDPDLLLQHALNNALQGAVGFLELVRADPGFPATLLPLLREVEHAHGRASAVVNQPRMTRAPPQPRCG